MTVKNEHVHPESDVEHSSPRESLALWFGILGGPIIWAVQLQVSYMLVPWACSTGHHWTLHLASLVFLLSAAAPAFIAWRASTTARSRGTSERESEGVGRIRFMAMLGLMTSALFLLLIFAQALPSFFIDPCQQ